MMDGGTNSTPAGAFRVNVVPLQTRVPVCAAPVRTMPATIGAGWLPVATVCVPPEEITTGAVAVQFSAVV